MLKKLLKHSPQIAIVAVLVFFLAAVRAFEDVIFYDPFLDYFKRNFTSLPLPQADVFKLSMNLFFRYFLNAFFSLAIIYTIFKKWDLVKFAAILYVVFFVILLMAFFFSMACWKENKMVLFYIRRFLIQPLFLLLFIPAFYFQERASGKNNIP